MTVPDYDPVTTNLTAMKAGFAFLRGEVATMRQEIALLHAIVLLDCALTLVVIGKVFAVF